MYVHLCDDKKAWRLGFSGVTRLGYNEPISCGNQESVHVRTYLVLAVFEFQVTLHEQMSSGCDCAPLYGATQIKHGAVALHHSLERLVCRVLQKRTRHFSGTIIN